MQQADICALSTTGCLPFGIVGSTALTAKLGGLDPSFYLRTVLAQIADHPINRIGQQLPWNLAANLQSEQAEAAQGPNRCPLKISGHLIRIIALVKRGASHAYEKSSMRRVPDLQAPKRRDSQTAL